MPPIVAVFQGPSFTKEKTSSSSGPTLRFGAPHVLFQTDIEGGGIDEGQGWQYDVAPDGRFLINQRIDAKTPPITLLQNWRPERQ